MVNLTRAEITLKPWMLTDIFSCQFNNPVKKGFVAPFNPEQMEVQGGSRRAGTLPVHHGSTPCVCHNIHLLCYNTHFLRK